VWGQPGDCVAALFYDSTLSILPLHHVIQSGDVVNKDICIKCIGCVPTAECARLVSQTPPQRRLLDRRRRVSRDVPNFLSSPHCLDISLVIIRDSIDPYKQLYNPPTH
jgi:hypothetical protein